MRWTVFDDVLTSARVWRDWLARGKLLIRIMRWLRNEIEEREKTELCG
jgi:hypothetical protein